MIDVLRRIPAAVLALMVAINLGRGAIHAFAPDGGAHAIAGLDLSSNCQTILSLFATLGFQQIVLGLFELFVLLRRRDLLTIALALQSAETALALLNLYFYRTFPIVVPGQLFNVTVLAVLLVALASSVGQRERATSG